MKSEQWRFNTALARLCLTFWNGLFGRGVLAGGWRPATYFIVEGLVFCDVEAVTRHSL